MKLAERVHRIQPSPTLVIDAKAKALKAEGIDVIGFGAGEPDFDTPENIREAGKSAIDSGFTRYTPVGGTDELKDAIIAKLLRDNGLTYARDQISVACGAKHSLYNLSQALIQEGDEVIIPSPYWVSYPEQVVLAGGAPVFIRTDERTAFKITPELLEKAITPRTKALILNSPCNPTGSSYSADELRELGRVCLRQDFLIISDDIYESLIYDGLVFSNIASAVPELASRTIVVNGVSKTYAMTGWRIGFMAAAEWVVKGCNKLQGQYTSGPASMSQKAAEAAWNGPQECVEEMRVAFQRRKDLIVRLCREVPGLEVNDPAGAFYLFPKCSSYFGKKDGERTINTSTDLAMYLLDVAHVATVGGDDFGAPECFRMSYATSDENIVEAIRRIKEALARLK